MYFFCWCLLVCGFCFFLFKQKTAYEMRISDWSSDVCSSDLVELGRVELAGRGIVAIGPEQITPPSALYRAAGIVVTIAVHRRSSNGLRRREQIGRASCRESVCQYV